jgi:hypothetical protein
LSRRRDSRETARGIGANGAALFVSGHSDVPLASVAGSTFLPKPHAPRQPLAAERAALDH